MQIKGIVFPQQVGFLFVGIEIDDEFLEEVGFLRIGLEENSVPRDIKVQLGAGEYRSDEFDFGVSGWFQIGALRGEFTDGPEEGSSIFHGSKLVLGLVSISPVGTEPGMPRLTDR